MTNRQPQGHGIAVLADLASSPMASDGQRVVLNALLQREMQSMMPQDPMTAIQLEKARLELGRLRNPGQQPVKGVVFDGNLGTRLREGSLRKVGRNPDTGCSTPKRSRRETCHLGLIKSARMARFPKLVTAARM